MADDAALESMRIAGSTLGPLFLHDPIQDAEAIEPLYEILAQSDPAVLAAEWPFVDKDQALPLLATLTAGAAAHLDAQDGAEGGGWSAPDALTEEYRRLFVGPGHKAAAPWGSVYTDKDQVVFGASTLELRDWLRRNGIAVNRNDNSDEPEDHIGTMLVLLAWIAGEKPEAAEEYLREHLLPWAPHFLELMERESDQEFFQALAALTRLTLMGMQEQLKLEVEIPRFYR